MKRASALCAVLVAGLALTANAADLADKLTQEGQPDLKSAGPLAFAPDGILLVGDTANAAVYAIDTGDRTEGKAAKYMLEKLDEKVASLLGATARDILINDLAVNPISKKAYLSVSRGRGPDAAAVIVRVDSAGKVEAVSLKNVRYAKAALPDAPAPGGSGRRNKRAQSITDLEYVDGRVFIAGLSNEEFASRLRSIPFPFSSEASGTSVEVFHGAHGKFETHSPVRTFTVYPVEGQNNLLAAYTCTPLVRFPVAQLKAGEKIRGVTIAELGNRNRPLDMVVYSKDGKDYLLIANSSRGVMKVPTEGFAKIEGITERVSGTAGAKYDTVESLKGVEQLDKLSDDMALLVVRGEAGVTLESIALP